MLSTQFYLSILLINTFCLSCAESSHGIDFCHHLTGTVATVSMLCIKKKYVHAKTCIHTKHTDKHTHIPFPHVPTARNNERVQTKVLRQQSKIFRNRFRQASESHQCRGSDEVTPVVPFFFFFFSSFNSAAWVPRTLLRTKARIKRNKFATQQCNTMFKEAGRWGIACYGKQNRHSKKTHFSVLLQSNKNEQERLQDEECQARAGATVAPQGQWCLLSAVHSSGTTPAKSRCNVTGLARQFWPLPHRRRLPQELSSAPPVLTRRRADVLQQAAATNLKSLSVFFVS